MLPLDAKPVEAYLDDVDVSRYLDQKFFGILSRRLPGVRAIAITLMHEATGKDVHGDPNIRTITIWYPERPRAGKSQDTVSVDTSAPEDLEETLQSMKEFRDGTE
jgi:hypothetical protein